MAIDNLIKSFGRNVWIVEKQTAGLSHADGLLRPPFRGNSLNWVLGHVVVSRQSALKRLGVTAELLSEEEVVLYRRGAEPLGEGDQAAPLEKLVSGMRQSQEQLVEALEAADLNQVIDQDGNTLRENIQTICWHETYHVGQLELLRQLAGTDDVVIP